MNKKNLLVFILMSLGAFTNANAWQGSATGVKTATTDSWAANYPKNPMANRIMDLVDQSCPNENSKLSYEETEGLLQEFQTNRYILTAGELDLINPLVDVILRLRGSFIDYRFSPTTSRASYNGCEHLRYFSRK